MCGIVGHINFQKTIERTAFITMRDTLAHRGPDDAGAVFFENDSIALGHRRLSFLDLSVAGRQPMSNEKETVWITLNGEIYNYIELRNELLKLNYRFKTGTDTEVIIHGYEEWGTDIVSKLKGMFAFGLVDLKKNQLLLARDTFGIKPLYYYQHNRQLIFASELKAILKCSDVKREIDFTSFADYFIYRYVPSPKSIWKNISKLPPAHFLIYNYKKDTTQLTEYRQFKFGSEKINEQDLISEMGKMLEQSVGIHARSDVPVGSFLSGGYDSSAIVYYLTKRGYKPETFSIGFENWQNSEHQFAQLVADHLKVPHHVTLATDATLDLLDIMPHVYDEPIADISILPTWLVSHAAVQKVKAVMSGEGADELFGGYTWQKEFYNMNKALPALKKMANKISGKNNFDTVEFYANAMAMGKFGSEELKQMLLPDFHSSIPEDSSWFYRKNFNSNLSAVKSLQQLDIKCFMAELVLTKIDRATMANSLEARVPFLDYDLFEKILQVNEDVYFKPETTKFILHENISKHLPASILERKKQGFVGPDEFYMNIEWYKNVLGSAALIRDGIINAAYCERLLNNKDHWRLWKLAVMEKWYKRWATSTEVK